MMRIQNLAGVLVALPLLFAASNALADSDWIPPITDPLTRAECGECHMAFQAGFLPARSWAKMMDDLDRHFGEDASLPPEKADAIRTYLTQNAGDVRGGGISPRFMKWVDPNGYPLRLTENPKFLKEHRKIDWTGLKTTPVKSILNCTACHRQAEKGLYDDD